MPDNRQNAASNSIGEPLRTSVYRRIWLASLLSNLGLMIQAVGAAWSMTQLTSAADMVALVQTALMLPILLLSIAAGALADMYDRRNVAIAALAISLAGATGLAILTAFGLLSPWMLLACCFAIGTGMALFGPAWQASVSEQVPADILPQAVALNSISYNIARSLGPAIGGIIVASAGAVAAFSANAVLYLPLLIVLLLWKRHSVTPRLPPERLGRAITSGIRYVMHSPSIRVVLARTLAMGVSGASVSALMPLVARDLLKGGPETYGIILGAFGVGAVAGALNISRIRDRFSGERALAICCISMAGAVAIVAASTSVMLTSVALMFAGAAWMVSVTQFNIAIQMPAPRWVAGRTLAAFQATLAGGIAVGSWIWGHIAQDYGSGIALYASAATIGITPLLGYWLRMPVIETGDHEAVHFAEPDAALALTARSGPIVIEIEYKIDPADARQFYGLMQKVQLIRHRNGAYNWTMARDISDPGLWMERFHCPTWFDYLRHRNRNTPADLHIQDEANDMHIGDAPPQVRRLLERPFGSVRWKDDAPDAGSHEVLPINAS